MADEKPRGTVEINDFAGLATNADPRDLPPGTATIQVNATCIRLAELVVRGGIRELSFEA